MQRVLVYFAALVLSAAVLAGGVRVVADHTAALDRFKGGAVAATGPPPTAVPGPVPAEGQSFVTGSADHVTAEGAQGVPVATPFTLSAVERGTGKATIDNALVEGKRTSIAWGGGTPLPITGDGGALDLGGTKVDVDAGGVTWAVDGGARALKPGKYRAGAPVAVGLGGLATPRDAVDFTADAMTTIGARGGVVVKVPPQRVELTGPGKVSAGGQLRVRDRRTTKPAASVQLVQGPYTITLVPEGGRLRIDAVLQGPLTVS